MLHQKKKKQLPLTHIGELAHAHPVFISGDLSFSASFSLDFFFFFGNIYKERR